MSERLIKEIIFRDKCEYKNDGKDETIMDTVSLLKHMILYNATKNLNLVMYHASV